MATHMQKAIDGLKKKLLTLSTLVEERISDATRALEQRDGLLAADVIGGDSEIDEMEVEAQAAIAPPRFSVEMLRNDGRVSVIGLIPTATNREATIASFNAMVDVDNVADLLETANYPAPDNWQLALDFAISAMALLPLAAAAQDKGAGTLPKVLRFAFPVAETGFDPVQINDLYSSNVLAHIFDAPLTYDYLARPVKVKPATATSLPHA